MKHVALILVAFVLLAQDNPPLMRSMAGRIADLFGWVLNGSFSRQEQEEFTGHLSLLSRSADRATIESYLKLVDAGKQLAPAGRRSAIGQGHERRQLQREV